MNQTVNFNDIENHREKATNNSTFNKTINSNMNKTENSINYKKIEK